MSRERQPFYRRSGADLSIHQCPDCGAYMIAVQISGTSGRDTYICQKAIGEQAYDKEFRRHFIPEGYGYKHRFVTYWRVAGNPPRLQPSEYQGGHPAERVRNERNSGTTK